MKKPLQFIFGIDVGDILLCCRIISFWDDICADPNTFHIHGKLPQDIKDIFDKLVGEYKERYILMWNAIDFIGKKFGLSKGVTFIELAPEHHRALSGDGGFHDLRGRPDFRGHPRAPGDADRLQLLGIGLQGVSLDQDRVAALDARHCVVSAVVAGSSRG